MRFLAPRILYLVALALTIALGLLSRTYPVGWPIWDKSLGDSLYAIAAYLVLRLLLPRLPLGVAVGLALGFCYGIEGFKLTGLPAAWSSFRLSRMAFGTTPSWHNILCHTLAIVGAAVLDAGMRRLGSAAAAPGTARPAAAK